MLSDIAQRKTNPKSEMTRCKVQFFVIDNVYKIKSKYNLHPIIYYVPPMGKGAVSVGFVRPSVCPSLTQ